MKDPFEYPAPPYYGVKTLCVCGTDDRIRKLAEFDAKKLRQVIVYPGMQTTVVKAAQRRLRKLGL